MHVLIDEKPSEPLTPEQQREISLWTMKDSFQGSMLSADEAADLIEAIASRVPNAELRLYEGGHAFLIQDRIALPEILDFLAG